MANALSQQPAAARCLWNLITKESCHLTLQLPKKGNDTTYPNASEGWTCLYQLHLQLLPCVGYSSDHKSAIICSMLLGTLCLAKP